MEAAAASTEALEVEGELLLSTGDGTFTQRLLQRKWQEIRQCQEQYCSTIVLTNFVSSLAQQSLKWNIAVLVLGTHNSQLQPRVENRFPLSSFDGALYQSGFFTIITKVWTTGSN